MVLYILTFSFLDSRREDKRLCTKHSLNLICSWSLPACNFDLLVLFPNIWILPHLQRTCSLSLCCKGKKVNSPTTRHAGAWGERKYSSYSFSTSALDGGEWSASRPGRTFTPGERIPCTHCTAGLVGPRAGLDTEDRGKILCPRRGSNPGRLDRSQTLYCLS
jgi:hypothetical protein